MSPHAVLVLAGSCVLGLSGCNSPAYDAFAAQQDKYASSSGSSGAAVTTGEVVTGDVMTSSTGGGSTGAALGESTSAMEATETTSEPGTTSTGEAENAAPQIFAFGVSPEEIFEAGAVQLELEASDDVVEVEVRYGNALVATVPADAFPYSFDVTSQTVCDGAQSFTVTVRDAEGLTDTSPADLYCQLPAPGSEVYTRVLPGQTASGGAAVVSLPDGAVIVAGGLDGRMALWRLDPEGNVLQGWPKTLAGWTATPGLAAKESTATSVARDSTGAIVVAGTVNSGITTRRYLAKLSDKGALLWEDPGLKDGEDIAGVAVSPSLEIVAAGSCRTSPLDQDPAYDACTWGYPKGYPKQAARWSDQIMQPDTDVFPDKSNLRSERGRAVLAQPDGRFTVFGEREYVDGDFILYTRATMQRYGGGVRDGGLWTSPGSKMKHDGFFAATITEAGMVAAGWCRHAVPSAERQVCVQEFDPDSALVGLFVETSPTQAEARGVAQDREHKLVISGFANAKPGQLDAWIFASRGADQPLAWSQKYDGGEWDFANGVACDLWGHCTWVGTTTKDGALALVVSRRHP